MAEEGKKGGLMREKEEKRGGPRSPTTPLSPDGGGEKTRAVGHQYSPYSPKKGGAHTDRVCHSGLLREELNPARTLNPKKEVACQAREKGKRP